MNFSQQTKANLGLGLYASGIVVSIILALFLAWADFEASFFEYQTQMAMLFGRSAEKGFDTFSCPLAITRNEKAEILVSINNPSDRQVKSVLRMTQTEGSVINVKRIEENLVFSPGQTLEFAWPVQATDAAWERFIMVRAFMIPSSPLPSMANYCSILVINVPFLTGHQVLGLLGVLGVALMAAGWRVWTINAGQTVLNAEKNSRLMLAYSGLVLLGLLLAVFSSWIPAALVLLLNILVTLVTVSYRLLHS